MRADLYKGHSEENALITYTPPARLAESRLLAAPEIEAGSREYATLAGYAHVLWKRRWTVVTTVMVLTTIVAIFSFKMRPVYRAMSRVEVEAESPLVQSVNDLYQKANTDDAFVQTQIQVLKSDSLAWQTIEQLRLGENPGFADADVIAKGKPQDNKLKLIAEFKDRLLIELVPKTRMVTVGFESEDPRLAAQVSNSLVNNYIDYNFRRKYDATRQASGWMEQQLDELKAKVESSQQALVDYERQHAIASSGAKDRQSVDEQMLSDLSKDLTVAQADRIQKESLFNQARTNRAQIAALAHNDLLQKLEEKAAELNGQYLEARAQYGPKFPKVMRLQEQVDENQAQIEKEQNRVIDRIRSEYAAAVNREHLAMTAVGRQREQLGGVNQSLIQHNLLLRDFEANQQLYQSLMQRLKDATVSAGLRSTNIHIVDSALPPEKAVRPKKLLNIIVAFMAGLLLGAMLAFAQEGMDYSIKNTEELESLLQVPALGVIPLQKAGRRTAYGLRHRSASAAMANSSELALTVSERPTSVFAEAYRSLRTAILLSLANRPPKTILVTSAESGDGKTVSSANLAVALAQRKGPVLLIDCDLRKSGVTHLLKLENEKGMSTVLAGADTVEDVAQRFDSVPGLWIIPSGPVPPSPADLLSSGNMADSLAVLSAKFEHIVIDSPPILAVTDATILAGLVDGVVLVANSGHTSKGALLRARRMLDAASAKILGVILNKFDLRTQSYYGSYGWYPKSYPYGKSSSEA